MLVAAQARATADRERRRVRRRRAVVAASLTATLLSAGAVAAAAHEGVLSWQWLERPDAQASVTMPSGAVCDLRLMAWPEEGEVRYDGDPVTAAAADALGRIDLTDVDVSDALARQYESFEVLPPGVPTPDPTYPPGTNPQALGDPGPQPLTADEAYTNALLETVSGRVRADLSAQGITAPSSSEGMLDCSGETP